MLISELDVYIKDPILFMLATHNGREFCKELRRGVYEIGHFGSSDFLPGYDQYPEGLGIDPYGVCDNVEQLLEKCPELEASDRQFVVAMHRIVKKEQPPKGGWRWHKWGEYIGIQNPMCEYLHDEPIIEEVYVYHIYEKLIKSC